MNREHEDEEEAESTKGKHEDKVQEEKGNTIA